MIKEDLTINEIKGVFERLFISPSRGGSVSEENYYKYISLTDEQVTKMKDLAKRCKKYEDAYDRSSSKFRWELNHAREHRDLVVEFIDFLDVLSKENGKEIKLNMKEQKTESLEDITKRLQEEHIGTLKECAKKKTSCNWIRPGETIDVNGISLTRGFFYVGDYFKIPQSYRDIKAYDFRHWEYREHNRNYKLFKIYGTVIHADLPISQDKLKIVPFSSYIDMHPTQRFEYLEWLAKQKSISDISSETFLFYLFGLQLRMFIDDTTTNQDRLDIVKYSIDLNTQCQKEEVYYWELEYFIDAAISKFFINSLEELAPKELLPKLQLCREAIILNPRNSKNNKIMENISRGIMCVLNYDNSIQKQLLTDSFFTQFANMVKSELHIMHYGINWVKLQNVINEPGSSGHYEQYCINAPKKHSPLLYDYIFFFKLFPNVYSLGFFNQCINNCYKRIVKRIKEYNILSSGLLSSALSSISLFDEDFQNIHKKIHRIITEDEKFATIEKETNASEYAIEEGITIKHSISLNNERLAKVEKQTKQAQGLLSDIFENNDEEISEKCAENDVLLDILTILLTKESWKRNEVESLCQERHLMIGSVLEQINDYSYSKIDDAVIEDDGDTIYVMTEYKDELV